jgi:hypothetical protein
MHITTGRGRSLNSGVRQHMTRIVQTSLGVLFLGVGHMTATDALEKGAGFTRPPIVAKPLCSDPKPYYVDGWGPDVVGFNITLAKDLVNADFEADRLAHKYKFTIHSGGQFKGEYAFQVPWLEPEQIAALRCEISVNTIGLLAEVKVVTPHVALSNISLQADRER